jgi:hypothetical protein
MLSQRNGTVGIFPEGGIGRVGDVDPSFLTLSAGMRVPILLVLVTERSVTFYPCFTALSRCGEVRLLGEVRQQYANEIMASLGANCKVRE